MKILATSSMTPEYSWLWGQRVNDNISIIKQDFKKKNLELGKLEQLEEEKMQLGLDVNVQKLEADKLRKGRIRPRKI
ncbi:hypothetical protein Gotri_019364 [Gossypium trilobum]|uniref:Uncharacterized protein n=1 Tax=Gossypium trilobum TaxID=34281 RepID=A0A7J9ECM1_9ROSI|nr:hypothetical protein [Gossypium trilobum]